MIVVSDTSPIINLAAIGYLHLLPEIFGKVVIPKNVYDEIVIAGEGEPGAYEISKADWISVEESQNKNFILELDEILDIGEASAIALAVDLKADYLLIDESLGRNVAKKYNLSVMGLIGILFEAKKKGLILKVAPIMQDLISQAGFWINKQLHEEILKKDFD